VNICVVGGTTFFGKAIVEALLEQGHSVTLFSRGTQRPALLERVEHVQGDRGKDEDFAQLAHRHFDAVVDNIAYTARDVERALDVFRGNVGRYVLTSSSSVYYAGSMTMPVTEADVDFGFFPPLAQKDKPLWRYALGKLEAERALNDQDDVPFTIIRPPIVLGPEDPTLRGHFYFQRLLDGQPLLLTEGGGQSFRLVFSRDLARGYLLALRSNEALNSTYNLAQGEIVTLKQLVQLAAEALGQKPHIVSVPAAVFRATKFEYPEPYARMSNFIPDIDKATSELGYNTTPFAQWLPETARWYRETYAGTDTTHYDERDREVAFARWFQTATAAYAPQ